jgi:hypothetical protein
VNAKEVKAAFQRALTLYLKAEDAKDCRTASKLIDEGWKIEAEARRAWGPLIKTDGFRRPTPEQMELLEASGPLAHRQFQAHAVRLKLCQLKRQTRARKRR